MVEVSLDIKFFYALQRSNSNKGIDFISRMEIKNSSSYRILKFSCEIFLIVGNKINLEKIEDKKNSTNDLTIWPPNIIRKYELDLNLDEKEFLITPDNLLVHFDYEGYILNDEFSGTKSYDISNEKWVKIQNELGFRG